LSLPPKAANGAMEASIRRTPLETTIERRRKRASRWRWRAWSRARSLPWVSYQIRAISSKGVAGVPYLREHEDALCGGGAPERR
jgi:hypothetical protein